MRNNADKIGRHISKGNREKLKGFLSKEGITVDEQDKIFSLLPRSIPKKVKHKLVKPIQNEWDTFLNLIDSENRPILKVTIHCKMNKGAEYKFEQRGILKVFEQMIADYRNSEFKKDHHFMAMGNEVVNLSPHYQVRELRSYIDAIRPGLTSPKVNQLTYDILDQVFPMPEAQTGKAKDRYIAKFLT